MLRKLAPRLIFPPLTAAPPDFTSVVIGMGSTRPVEILLLMVLLRAFFAEFDSLVHLALPALKLDNSLLHFLCLRRQLLDHHIGLSAVVNAHVQIKIEPLNFVRITLKV